MQSHLCGLTRSPEINPDVHPHQSKKWSTYTKQWDYLETYTQACARAGFRPLTSRRVSTIINEFDLAGLAHVKNVFLGRHGRTKHVYSLIPKGIDAIQILSQDNPGLEAASRGAYKLQRRLG